MIKQKEWVIMRSLYEQGMKKAAIARQLGFNRKTVANN
jgi:transposase